MWFTTIILKMEWTERVSSKEVLKRMETKRKLLLRIRKRKAEIPCTYNDDRGLRKLRPRVAY